MDVDEGGDVAAIVPRSQPPRDEAAKRTGETDAAARTISRIKQKLEGYEDPNDTAMSVEGQVRLLIMEATDEENLHRIFCGWCAWM